VATLLRVPLSLFPLAWRALAREMMIEARTNAGLEDE
jgi:hypothetical protein